jgi:hypothetical protein
MNEAKPLTLHAAWRWLCRNACLCSIALALATVLCIGIGVAIEESKHACGLDLASVVVYETGQVMLLNMVTHLGSNYCIIVGRVLAVLLFVFLYIQAVAKLFGESWQNLRLLRYRRHHIVCGLGRIGWQLVQDLLDQGKRVVVIEKDPANPLGADARRLGAIVIIGDATDDEMLAHARLKKADAVYIATGSDETNIATAYDLLTPAQPPAAPDTPAGLPKCYVHIVDPALTEKVRGNSALPVAPFNVMRNTGLNLIVKHLTPMPVRPRERHEVALYVLVGFGEMGRSLAEQLAELAHFENRKRARLLILTENAPAAADAFLSRWGQFSPRVVAGKWSEIAFDPACDAWSCRTQGPGPAYQVADKKAIEYACNAVFAPCPSYIAERGFMDALTPLLREPGVKPAIIVCMDSEHENFRAAVTLEQNLARSEGAPDVPVFVWLPKQESLHRQLTGAPGAATAFGLCRDELRMQKVIDPFVGRLATGLAMAIMAEHHKLDPEKDHDKILQRWQADPERFRQSNRSAAGHALVALGCLGLKHDPVARAKDAQPVPLNLTEQQTATFAEMEHYRWVAERLLAGFTYGPRSDHDHPPRRPQLCTWEILGSDPELVKAQEQAKDIRQIKIVFATLQRLGSLVKA